MNMIVVYPPCPKCIDCGKPAHPNQAPPRCGFHIGVALAELALRDWGNNRP